MFISVKIKMVKTTIVFLVLMMSITSIFCFSASTINLSPNWGVKFRESNMPPTGNATSEFLRKYDAFFIGDIKQKNIYLTFDAGFEAGYTPKILDILKKHNVKATFFVVGHYLKTSPEIINRMVKEGHIVGNHTYSHCNVIKLIDFNSFQNEILTFEQLYKKTTGLDAEKLYRPPEGKFNEKNLEYAKKLGYKTFFWSLSYVDWQNPTKELALKKLFPRIHNGAIILLHNTSKTNADILDELLTYYKNSGYKFCSLKELK